MRYMHEVFGDAQIITNQENDCVDGFKVAVDSLMTEVDSFNREVDDFLDKENRFYDVLIIGLSLNLVLVGIVMLLVFIKL